MKTHAGWAFLLLLAGCGPKQDAKATTLATADTSCPDGFEVGPSDSCFAIPAKTDATTPVVIFLHDAHDAKGVTSEWSMARAGVERQPLDKVKNKNDDQESDQHAGKHG